MKHILLSKDGKTICERANVGNTKADFLAKHLTLYNTLTFIHNFHVYKYKRQRTAHKESKQLHHHLHLIELTLLSLFPIF